MFVINLGINYFNNLGSQSLNSVYHELANYHISQE